LSLSEKFNLSKYQLKLYIIREKTQVIQGFKIAHMDNYYIIFTINITKERKLKIVFLTHEKAIQNPSLKGFLKNDELSNINLEFNKATFLIM